MQRFELERHVSKRLELARRVGTPPPDAEMPICVLLHARDARTLRDAVRAVSDPASPDYGRFRTPEQVRNLVAPGDQDLDAVLSWLSHSGFDVEEPAGACSVVKARATAATVARTFDVPLGVFKLPPSVSPDRRSCISITRAPTIPAALAPVVRGVAGLNDLPAARRFPVLYAPKRSRLPRRGPGDTRGPGGGYTPATIALAYGLPVSGGRPAGGRDERVAILEFGGGFSPDDLSAFARQYTLPEGNVREVSISGAKNDYGGKTGDADAEVALDMDWVRATAPDAAIDMYWVPNVDKGWVDFLSALIDAPETTRPTVVSISWGMPEDGFSTSRRYDQTRLLFQSAALLGITFVCASGDAGAADELPQTPEFDGQRHVDFPSVVPEVTAVGGTKLLSAARGFTESAWNDGGGATGGGFSRFVKVPDWQKAAIGSLTGATGRGIPDVAAVASPDPGLSIRVHKRWTAVGGTSVAAPIWAGILAQMNALRRAGSAPRLGAANAALYALGDEAGGPFHDVTSGDNGFAGVDGFSAAKGWDPATGLGSPDAGVLARRLAPAASSSAPPRRTRPGRGAGRTSVRLTARARRRS